MVRPTLEYAGTVWDPHHQVHTRSLEWVQRRAARFVSGNFYDRTPDCVTAIINQLKWEPLEYRRLTSRLVMFYKITHDLIDINAPSYLLPDDVRTRVQIDIVNQQPTRISASSLSFQEPPLIGTGYQRQLHQPIPSRASVCSWVSAKLHTSHTRSMTFYI
jgi:hypothetical protein